MVKIQTENIDDIYFVWIIFIKFNVTILTNNYLKSKQMKRILFATAIALILFINIGETYAQTKPKLDQVELMKQFIGSWEKTGQNDTVWGYEIQKYGDVFLQINYHSKGGIKFLDVANTYCFYPGSGKFRIIGHTPAGVYTVWSVSFTDEKKLTLYQVRDFQSGKILLKHVVVITNPKKFTISAFTPEGKKTGESEWTKVK